MAINFYQLIWLIWHFYQLQLCLWISITFLSTSVNIIEGWWAFVVTTFLVLRSIRVDELLQAFAKYPTLSLGQFVPCTWQSLFWRLMYKFVDKCMSIYVRDVFVDSEYMKKLKHAVRGKRNMNITDLPHLSQFVHTGR